MRRPHAKSKPNTRVSHARSLNPSSRVVLENLCVMGRRPFTSRQDDPSGESVTIFEDTAYALKRTTAISSLSSLILS
jgi:hypothetical protein